MEAFFVHIDAMGDKLDPEDPSTFVDATELDNTTLESYCQQKLPGKIAVLSMCFFSVLTADISSLYCLLITQ